MLKGLDLILCTVNKQQNLLIRGSAGLNLTVTLTRMYFILRKQQIRIMYLVGKFGF